MGISGMNVYFYLSMARRSQCRVLDDGGGVELEGLGVQGGYNDLRLFRLHGHYGTWLHTQRWMGGMTTISDGLWVFVGLIGILSSVRHQR